jgi:hypothetical protein
MISAPAVFALPETFTARLRLAPSVLLKLLTTPDRAPIKAKYVTNVTHTLVESARSFANLGQHLIGQKVDFGTAFAAMCVCLELASRTSRELTAKVN